MTWNKLLEKYNDELIYCSLDESEMNRYFDDGFGGAEGTPFIAFSKDWVYFPTEYDGAENIKRVPKDLTSCKKVKYTPVHI